MAPTIETLIEHYELQPHPEGGYYKELYKAEGLIPQRALSNSFQGDRSYSTGIFYLLPKGSKSSFHKIPSDEMWHFYLGGPLNIVEITEEGDIKETRLGQEISNGCVLNYVVPGNTWFGAYPAEGTEYALVGCTVAPGFDFADFEMGEENKLVSEFPKAQDMVEKLMA